MIKIDLAERICSVGCAHKINLTYHGIGVGAICRCAAERRDTVSNYPIVSAVSHPQVALRIKSYPGARRSVGKRESIWPRRGSSLIDSVTGERFLSKDQVGNLITGGLGKRFGIAQDSIVGGIGHIDIPRLIYRHCRGKCEQRRPGGASGQILETVLLPQNEVSYRSGRKLPSETIPEHPVVTSIGNVQNGR